MHGWCEFVSILHGWKTVRNRDELPESKIQYDYDLLIIPIHTYCPIFWLFQIRVFNWFNKIFKFNWFVSFKKTRREKCLIWKISFSTKSLKAISNWWNIICESVFCAVYKGKGNTQYSIIIIIMNDVHDVANGNKPIKLIIFGWLIFLFLLNEEFHSYLDSLLHKYTQTLHSLLEKASNRLFRIYFILCKWEFCMHAIASNKNVWIVFFNRWKTINGWSRRRFR